MRAWSEASAEPHGRSCASGKGAGSQLTSSPDTKALCSFQSRGESFPARSVCICVIGPASASRSPLCAGQPPREPPGPSLHQQLASLNYTLPHLFFPPPVCPH